MKPIALMTATACQKCNPDYSVHQASRSNHESAYQAPASWQELFDFALRTMLDCCTQHTTQQLEHLCALPLSASCSTTVSNQPLAHAILTHRVPRCSYFVQ
eukprot:6193207-Pleurochrysis_carterae.AAC.5